MLFHVADTIERLNNFEETADPSVLAQVRDLLQEVRWHLENPSLSMCVQEAAFELGEEGYDHPSQELLEEATKALYFSETFIDGETAYDLVEKVIEERGLRLEDIIEDGEVLVEYGTTVIPQAHCIMAKESDDLMSALEDTLHRILLIGDEGDVNEIMGARRANDAEMDALAENDEEFIEIDDGYILPGYIAGMKKLEARRIKSLADLLFLDDRIVEFRTTAYPFPLHCIMGEKKAVTVGNIKAALSVTLGRMLANGATEADVRHFLGAIIPTDEKHKVMLTHDRYFDIGLGYILPGEILLSE